MLKSVMIIVLIITMFIAHHAVKITSDTMMICGFILIAIYYLSDILDEIRKP